MVLVPTGCNMRFCSEEDEFQRHLVAVLVEELLAFEVGFQGPLVVTQSELQENFHEGSQGTFLVDGHAHSADFGIGLGQQATPSFLVAAGNIAGIRLSGGQQSGGSGIIPRGQCGLSEAKANVPAMRTIIGPQKSGTHGLEPFDLGHVFLPLLVQKGQGGKNGIIENVEIAQSFQKTFLVLGGDFLVLANRRDPRTDLACVDCKGTHRALTLSFLGLVEYPDEILPVLHGEENPRVVPRVGSVLIVIPLAQFVQFAGLGLVFLILHAQ